MFKRLFGKKHETDDVEVLIVVELPLCLICPDEDCPYREDPSEDAEEDAQE